MLFCKCKILKIYNHSSNITSALHHPQKTMTTTTAANFKPNLKQKGNEYYREQQYALAAAMYRKYVSKHHEDNKNAYYNMSLCHFKLEKYEECIEACKEALRIDADFSKVYYRLALAYQKVENVYQTFASADQFCGREQAQKDRTALENSVDYKTMKQLRDSTKSSLLYASPIKIDERYKIFDYQHAQNMKNGSNTKQNSPNKQNIDHKLEQYFQGYSWSDVQNNLDKGQLTQALNQAYSIIRTTKQITNNDRDFQNFQLVKNIKKGKCDKSTRLILETISINNQIKDEQKQTQKESSNTAQTKQETQPGSDIKNEKQSLPFQQAITQDIYTQYFLKPLEKKPDIFEGFLTVVISILQNTHIETPQKQQILTKASKQYPMFMALQFSLTSKQKQEIRKQMIKSKIESSLAEVYCS